MGNLNDQPNVNSDLETLLAMPMEEKGLQWELKFFDTFLNSVLDVAEEPQPGPDGLVYLLASTAGANCTEPAHQVVKWLATRGIGLVVNPQKEYPDFVFSYGMLWHYKEFGVFVNTSAQVQQHGAFESKGGDIKLGDPSFEYLPEYVRSILREFFRQQSVLQPRVKMISDDGGKNYDLAFSLESLGNPNQKEHEGVLQAISWFLPPHYSLSLVSEEGLEKFKPL
jgi:hypothetical protein